MLHFPLLLADAAGPLSQSWSPTIAIVMVVCNVLGIIAATTSKVKAGPALFAGLTVGQLLGGTSFGHLLAAGAILGLTRTGVI
jgi:photosystem I subunit X